MQLLKKFYAGILLVIVATLFLTPLKIYAFSQVSIVVGISQYPDFDIPDLKWADADAIHFSNFLNQYCGVNSDNIITLINKKASKKNIESSFVQVKEKYKYKKIDHFFLFFSGHALQTNVDNVEGIPIKRIGSESEFLAPSDADITLTKEINHSGSATSKVILDNFLTKEWLIDAITNINASSITLIIDACYSDISDFSTLIQKHTKNINIIPNYVLLSASKAYQKSVEWDELKHGALSYALFSLINYNYYRSLKKRQFAWESILLTKGYQYIDNLFKEKRINGKALIEYQSPSIEVFPNSQVNSAILFNLAFPSNTGYGLLEIKTKEKNIEVIHFGKILQPIRRNVYQLPTGDTIITISRKKSNYNLVLPVNIQSDRKTSVHYELNSKMKVQIDDPLRPDLGNEGKVYLNGKYIGKTNKLYKNLDAGNYELKIDYSGVKKTTKISLRPDSPLTIVYHVQRIGKESKENKMEKSIMKLPM